MKERRGDRDSRYKADARIRSAGNWGDEKISKDTIRNFSTTLSMHLKSYPAGVKCE
jgi:hypothetical protein